MFSFFKLHKASVPSQTSDAVITQIHPDYPSLDGVYETSYPGCQSISKCISSTGNEESSLTLTEQPDVRLYMSMTIQKNVRTIRYLKEVA